ncbi:hypothetical protein IFM89_010934 [Coptis chinensis]|uniref:Uncharacterized protein n=1 Tax=Coptis chinensis TaxID=261450 RepID=A0A835MAU6_9MAGN|nr:hypothetical protein IFM89_010934 [Coptis chinensis]
MGICSSSDSTSIATAKLVFQDGKLQEYAYPVKVSQVLQKYPSYFICNSDEMEFDDFISAISADEVLQPGQLYFALPLGRLKYPLQAEDMAALAVKASLALSKSTGGACVTEGVVPIGFSAYDRTTVRQRQVDNTNGGDVDNRMVVRRTKGGSGGRRRSFSSDLSAIEE